MNSNKRNTSWFDDDFEVTYDDDIHSEFDFNTTKLPDNKPKKSPAKPSSKKVDLSIPDAVHQKNRYYTDNRYDNDTSDSIDSRKISRRYQNEEPDYRDEEQPSRVKKQGRRRRRNSPARLAAPLQKGENALFNISKSLVRNLSALLILAIIALMLYNFFHGSAPYGDIENAVSTQTYSQMLSAYTAVAAVLILFEVISLLWSMSKARVRDAYGRRREDVGRGQFSFIFIYLLSYAAFLFSKYIPELSDVLKGIKGALDVFGALHNALFGLCLAGVVSCYIRKHSQTL